MLRLTKSFEFSENVLLILKLSVDFKNKKKTFLFFDVEVTNNLNIEIVKTILTSVIV